MNPPHMRVRPLAENSTLQGRFEGSLIKKPTRLKRKRNLQGCRQGMVQLSGAIDTLIAFG